MNNEQHRLELRATRALYIRSHPELYTPEVVAEAMRETFDHPNPSRGVEGEPDVIAVDPTTVEIRFPAFRDALGLPRLGADATEAATAAPAVEASAPSEPDPVVAAPEPPVEPAPPAPKLESRKRSDRRFSR